MKSVTGSKSNSNWILSILNALMGFQYLCIKSFIYLTSMTSYSICSYLFLYFLLSTSGAPFSSQWALFLMLCWISRSIWSNVNTDRVCCSEADFHLYQLGDKCADVGKECLEVWMFVNNPEKGIRQMWSHCSLPCELELYKCHLLELLVVRGNLHSKISILSRIMVLTC